MAKKPYIGTQQYADENNKGDQSPFGYNRNPWGKDGKKDFSVEQAIEDKKSALFKRQIGKPNGKFHQLENVQGEE